MRHFAPDVAAECFRVSGFQHNIDPWFRALPEVARASVASRRGKGSGQYLVENHAASGWANFGLSVFSLTDSLVSKFLLTEIDEEPPQLPFPTFLMHAPGLEAPTVLVHRYAAEEVPSLPPSCGPFSRADVDWFSVAWGGERLLALMSGDGSLRGGYYMWPPDDFIRGILRPTYPLEMVNCMRVIRGLCSFLEARVEPLVLENKTTVERARVENRPVQRVFTVGRTIKINSQLRKAARAVRDGKTTTAWKLDHKSIVRGHWKWQAVGSVPEVGPRPAKKIWVEPYWRGPEASEAWRKTYEVSA